MSDTVRSALRRFGEALDQVRPRPSTRPERVDVVAWKVYAKAMISSKASTPSRGAGKPSSLLDTRVVYCGDNLEQLKKLPGDASGGCVDLIYIDPPFNSNRNYEVFWGETKEKRSFEDRHASTQAYIDNMWPHPQK